MTTVDRSFTRGPSPEDNALNLTGVGGMTIMSCFWTITVSCTRTNPVGHIYTLAETVIITRKVQRSNGSYRYYISSMVSVNRKKKQESTLNDPFQPIPLAYLGIDRFDLPPESRKEKPEDGGGILDSLRFSNTVQMYPFTIYHTVNKADRTYTFYASSESARKKWYDAILDALSVYNVKMEANRVCWVVLHHL